MIAHIEIKFVSTVTTPHDVDLGSLKIRHHSGRSTILDVYTSSVVPEDETWMLARAKVDTEIYPKGIDTDYDLTLEDIKSGMLDATFFVTTENNEVTQILYSLEDANGETIISERTADQEL